MTLRAAILSALVLTTMAGCGQSRLNPFNWFRSAPEGETLAPLELEARVDRRPLVAEITSLVVERTPGGAIIRATGLPPEQGWYDPELVNEDRDGRPIDGVLAISFRARPPLEPTRVSTAQSRELSAAVYISDIALGEANQIVVTGSQNSRAARR